MNFRNDLSNTITQGTPARRLTLLLNDWAEQFFNRGEGVLTEIEEEKLVGSFRKAAEICLYNRHFHLFHGLQNGFSVLKQFSQGYMEAMAQLRGYALYDHTRSEITDFANSIYFTARGRNQKARILKTIETCGSFFFFDLKAKPDPEKDGIAAEDPEQNLEKIIRILQARATADLAGSKAAAEFIGETLKENDLSIPCFQDQLAAMVAGLKEDHAFLPKYSKRKTVAVVGADHAHLFQDHWIFPDYDDVAPDLELKEKLKKECIEE